MGTVLKRKGVRGLATAALTAVLVFGFAAPAMAFPIIILPPIFFLQWMTGTVVDAGTTAPVQGIIVSAYKNSDGSYVWSSVTGADGKFAVFLSPSDYKLQFRDPSNRYGDQWGYNQANMIDATPNTLTSGVNFDWGNIQLRQAGTIRTVVRRAGHPLTVLPGQFLILQQKSGLSTLQQWSGTTSGAVSYAWPGLRTYNVTYLESAIDPTGRFYAGDSAAGWHSIVGGTVLTTFIDLSPAGASREITPGVPASKTPRTRNVSFGVTGSFSKAIANGTQLKILAVKGGTTKTFNGKIKSNKYSSTVKLGKGTWKLYALFKGNSTFAANDSLNYKTVVVK